MKRCRLDKYPFGRACLTVLDYDHCYGDTCLGGGIRVGVQEKRGCGMFMLLFSVMSSLYFSVAPSSPLI